MSVRSSPRFRQTRNLTTEQETPTSITREQEWIVISSSDDESVSSDKSNEQKGGNQQTKKRKMTKKSQATSNGKKQSNAAMPSTSSQPIGEQSRRILPIRSQASTSQVSSRPSRRQLVEDCRSQPEEESDSSQQQAAQKRPHQASSSQQSGSKKKKKTSRPSAQLSKNSTKKLQKEFSALEKKHGATKEKFGAIHNSTLTDLTQLGFVACFLEKRDHVEEWDTFLTLLKRTMRAAGKDVTPVASYMINEFTSKLFDQSEMWKCMEVCEAMMVGAHGTGYELCYVLSHMTWCLFQLNQLEDCEGVLLAMDLQGEYHPVGFSDLYHTATCLEREGRPLAARRWEEHLRTMAEDPEGDHVSTLEIVAEIKTNIVSYAQIEGFGAHAEIIKLYDIVLNAFRTSPKFKVFLEQAEKQREECMRTLE